jgi:predicted site-specific integrase-resolvase
MAIKLSRWAKNNDITYTAAYEMYKAGKIPGARQLQTGSIVVDEDVVTMCEVCDAKTKRKFTIKLDVDLNANHFSGADQKSILDEINSLANTVALKLGFSAITKKWTP